MYSGIIRDNVPDWNKVAFHHFSRAYAVVVLLSSVTSSFGPFHLHPLYYAVLLWTYYTYGLELYDLASLIFSIVRHLNCDAPVPVGELARVAEDALFYYYVLSVSTTVWCVIFWATGFGFHRLFWSGPLIVLASMALQRIPSGAGAKCKHLWAAACDRAITVLLHLARRLLASLALSTRFPRPMRMGRESYSYQRLIGSKDIRLLKLRRRRLFRSPQCELVHVDMHSLVTYDAISYTWGNPEKSKGLIVDGKWLPCPANVQDIVLDRASYSCERYVWIDFVCIDQDNLDERKQQVQLMREIYATANRVIVWLGGTSGADLALDLLYDLRNLVLRDPEASTLDGIQLGAQYRKRLKEWTALAKFLNHDYWTRTWIIQEIAVAERVHVMYNGRYLLWEYLAAFAIEFSTVDSANLTYIREMIATGLPLPSGTNHILYLATTRLKIQRGGALKLAKNIAKFHDCHATDPRDKIYAIQGITTANEAGRLVPDYEKSTEEVYMETTLYLMELEYPFYPLHFAGIGNSGRMPRLPSWIPDWSLGRHHTALGHWANNRKAYYRASGHDFSKRHSVRTIGNTLSVQGCLIDKIAQVNTTHTRRPLDESTANYPYGPFAVDLAAWEQEARAMLSQVPDPYDTRVNNSTGQPRTETFARTLIADMVSKPTYCRPAPAAYIASFRAHAELSKIYEQVSRLLHGTSDPQDSDVVAAMSFVNQFNRVSSMSTVPTGKEASAFLASIGVRSDLSPAVLAELLRLTAEMQHWMSEALLWKHMMGQACIGRSFAVTKKGYMGLVPEGTVAGDDCVLFLGMQTPVVVRREGTESASPIRAQLVGEVGYSTYTINPLCTGANSWVNSGICMDSWTERQSTSRMGAILPS
jgi:hypothetical protein